MDKEHLSSHQLKSILKKYLDGSATPEEIQQIEHWYAVSGETRDIPEKSRLQKEIIAGILRHTAPRLRTWPRIAAAALVLIIAGAGFYYYNVRTSASRMEAQLIQVPFGERKSIQLPDGSNIHLNAGSRLTIGQDYGTKERRIDLSGEAFFEVAADPEHPFIINTGDITTTVLGTSFNIRAYPEQREWRISIASGGVKVLRRQEVLSASLTANKELSYDHASRKVTLASTGPVSPDGWRNNLIYFSNSSLEEIAMELQRQYNVPISVHGRDNGHYKISFHRQPLKEILNVLSGLTGATYTTQQDTIIIHTKKRTAE